MGSSAAGYRQQMQQMIAEMGAKEKQQMGGGSKLQEMQKLDGTN